MPNRITTTIKSEIKLLRKIIHHRIYSRFYVITNSEKDIVNGFHKLYFDSADFGKTWGKTFWLGVEALKCPLDLWVYQEIIFEVKPDIIVECGTAAGGSALFLASMCELINHGTVITIDIEDVKQRPKHNRIIYLLGSSTSKAIVEGVSTLIKTGDKVMVILDSDHTKKHVLNELRIYSKFVTKGSYLIVEDTNLNGHPVEAEYGLGPMEAIEEFLNRNRDFVVDTSKEKHLLTFNPSGYIKRLT